MKNTSSILLLFVVLVLIVSFTGCDKLSVTKLEANHNLKKANQDYTEEKYKAAIKGYEKALELNPELKVAYIYLGTACSQSFRPGKQDARNQEFADKGIKYLLLAKEFEPENDTVVLALGDLYDKTGKYEEAEQMYQLILTKKGANKEEKQKALEDKKTQGVTGEELEKAEKDAKEAYSTLAKAYYTLASFYTKNGKAEKAEEMYKKRIELDYKDPEGYHFYVGFLQDQRRWADAIAAHEKRLYAMLDPEIITTLREVDVLAADAEEVNKVTKLIGTIKKNKLVAKEEKERLIAEAEERIAGKIGGEEAEKKIAEIKAGLEGAITAAEEKIATLESEEMKKEISIAYYSIGNVCWNWSFQTPPIYMAAQERKVIIDRGISALERAMEIQPDYSYPYAYMGLLNREMIKVDPLNAEKYKKINDDWNKKFTQVYKKIQKRQALEQEIDQMGKKEE